MDVMWIKKGRYISLKDKPTLIPDRAEKKYRLFTPRVQISGPRHKRSRKPSRGIPIQIGSVPERSPLVDLSSILRAVVYGISFLVFTIGNLFKDPKGGGQLNGGQA
jgi:hypothetical protein